ncbi:MAG: sulfite exporter TauE/SafE family protein [Acidobacteriota bacterium]
MSKTGVLRRWAYPATLVVVYTGWLAIMVVVDGWRLFAELWPISLTMTLGSFVAGATAEGGAAVAFPVFTKALGIAPTDARTFGLMIQAVGMTAAAVVIWARRIPILPRVIWLVTGGGVIGQVLGSVWLVLPNPYPRLLFTFVAAAFGAAMALSRWRLGWRPRRALDGWTPLRQAAFVAVGVAGGTFAAQTGSGIDMLTFIVLTLAFGIDERVSTPTTVVIMALNSIVGFALHGLVLREIGVAWSYWLVAVPIVVLGAPLGAAVASKLQRDHIIGGLLFLILLEVVTTVWLVPVDLRQAIIVAVAVALCALWFRGLLRFRAARVPEGPPIGHDAVPSKASG